MIGGGVVDGGCPGLPLEDHEGQPTSGLPGVWSTALATLAVLLMLGALLWVVSVNAFGWFWPARIAEIHEWDATSVDADRTRTGLEGSWTQVHHLFSPAEARSKECDFVSDPVELLGKMKAAYEVAAEFGSSLSQ